MPPRRLSLPAVLIALLVSAFTLGAKETAGGSPQETQGGDSVVASLLTCWPGPEVYELCGHEALRIRTYRPGAAGALEGALTDSVWNYGVFDFAQPNFIYRFVKGETDYMLAGYPFAYFLEEYRTAGRKVAEQKLNLTQPEARRLRALVQREGRPDKRTYRYNYVKDNCATRIADRIEQASDTTVIWPDSVKYGTFREEMRAYHKNYPWYQFGIDLALGNGIDRPETGKAEMFVPLEMMERASGARLADGRDLTAPAEVLYEGEGDRTLPATHWAVTPLFISWVLFILAAILCCLQVRRGLIYRIWYTLWFLILGLTGILVAFLVFVSTHEATAPNLLILWLNPLQLVMAAGIWWRKWRIPVLCTAYYNIIALTVLLIVWPVQGQSANAAFFPLMGSTLALAATYAIVNPGDSRTHGAAKRGKHLYEKTRKTDAGGNGRPGRTLAGSRRKTAAGGRNRG